MLLQSLITAHLLFSSLISAVPFALDSRASSSSSVTIPESKSGLDIDVVIPVNSSDSRVVHLHVDISVLEDAIAGAAVANSSPTTSLVTTTTVSSQISGGGTAVPLSSTGQSTSVLIPATHWDIDTSDPIHLVPSIQSTLYYGSDGSASASTEHLFASLTTSNKYPAIIAEHSELIGGIQCIDSGLVITFTSASALSTAQTSWNSTFLLITHTLTCASASSASRVYFLITSSTFNIAGLTVTVVASQVSIQQAINDVAMSFGNYTPIASPANTTTAAVVNGTCGSAPSSYIDGFPTASCGSSFDQTLDDALGYLDYADEATYLTTLRTIAPGLSAYTDAELQEAEYNLQSLPRSVNPLAKRSLRSVFKKISKAVKKAVSTVSADVEVAKTVVTNAVNTATTAVITVINQITSYDPSFSTSGNIALVPTPQVQSPFGSAFELFNQDSHLGSVNTNVGLYCVDCGVTGTITISGHVGFSLVTGQITAGSVTIAGNLNAGGSLGVSISAEYSNDIEIPIAQASVPGFELPDIISIGPTIALSADIGVDISASGTILAGARMSIPSFSANLDLINVKDSKFTAATPVFTPSFEVSTSISATLTLGLPISLGVGVTLYPLGKKGDYALTLISTPSISATAGYAYTNTNPTSCNNGLAYSISAGFDESVDIFSFDTIDLFDYSATLISGCQSFNKRSLPMSPAEHKVRDLPKALARRQSDNSTTSSVSATPTVSSTVTTTSLIPSSTVTSNDDEIDYDRLYDISGLYVLSNDSNRNFGLLTKADREAEAKYFLSHQNITVADSDHQLMHYFPDVMAAYGVSRFRLSSKTIPATANLLGLAPLDHDNDASTSAVQIGIDTLGNTFFLVVCEMVGMASKIFLVKDVNAGIATLESGRVQYTVAGGVVTTCDFLAILSEKDGI